MTQITNKLLKEAIADAEAVRETAIANAKLALEESMGPQIRDMIARRLTAEASATETPHEDGEAEGSKEFPADSSDIGEKPNEEPSEDAFDTSDIGDTADAPEDSEDDWYEDWDEGDLAEIIKELENDIAALKGGDTDGEEDDSEEDMEDSEEESEDEEELTESKHDDDEDEEEKTEDDEDEEIDLEEILRELDMEMGDEDEEEVEGDEEELAELSPDTYDNAALARHIQGGEADAAGNQKLANKLYKRAEKTDAHAHRMEKFRAKNPQIGLSPASKRKFQVKEITRLRNELAQYQEALQVVRGRLLEVNLLNAKLLFTNKLFRKEGLNNDQKVRIVESFDRATTVREVKLVYTALMENISTAGKTSNGSRKKVVAKRLQELAGII
jgi:hypothetical protein